MRNGITRGWNRRESVTDSYQRREANHEEVKAREGHHVDGQLYQKNEGRCQYLIVDRMQSGWTHRRKRGIEYLCTLRKSQLSCPGKRREQVVPQIAAETR